MPRVTQAYRAARTEQILDAAVACFSRDGFHQTTMQDISREVGLTPRALYRYFSSKEEMIDAMWRRDEQARADRFHGALQAGGRGQALDELLAIYATRLGGEETQTDMRLWVQLLAEALRNPRIREYICETWDDVLGRLEALFIGASERGEVSADVGPEVLARLSLAAHDGLVLQRAIDPTSDISRYVEAARALFSGSPARARRSEVDDEPG